MASPAAARSKIFSQSKKTSTNTTPCALFVRTVMAEARLEGSLCAVPHVVGLVDAPLIWLFVRHEILWSSTGGLSCIGCLKVCLHNWWLIKVGSDSKGRRLGVGGFASREGQETRAFFSAPIAKRHDTVTLETTDDITITITGFINRSQTVENGFPSEVGNRFCLGFPHNWEEYTSRFCSEECVNIAIPSSISILDGFDISSADGTDSFPPICLNDLSVTHVRDLLMSSGADSGVLGKSIVNDIMQYLGDNETVGNEKRKDNNYATHPLTTENFVHEQVPRNHSKTKVDDKCKDDGSTQHSTDRGELKFQKITGECKMGINFNSLSRGVMTRSMTRLSNSRKTQQKNVSPNTDVTRRLTEVSGDQCGGFASRENDSSKRHGTIFSDAEVEANGRPHICTIPKNIRLETLSEPLSKSEAFNKRYAAVSAEEMIVSQIPDKSAVRRSDRLKKIWD